MSVTHKETMYEPSAIQLDKAVVVLLHCSAASGRSWHPVIEDLASEYAIHAPDLLGYGPTENWPRGMRLEMRAELERIQGCFEPAAQKVHIVGHSYGGTVAMAAARHYADRIASITLIEPVAFPLLRYVDHNDDWREIEVLAERHIRLVSEGRDREAAQKFIDYWAGSAGWQMLDETLRAYLVRSMPKVAAEWQMMLDSCNEAQVLTLPEVPTLLVNGSLTRQSVRRVLGCIAAALPLVDRAEIDGAGHLSPHTHPKQVAALIRLHVSRALGLRRATA